MKTDRHVIPQGGQGALAMQFVDLPGTVATPSTCRGHRFGFDKGPPKEYG